MSKLRTTSWFLLLLILLATLVAVTMAQEKPTAAGGQLFHKAPSDLLSGEPLAHSSEETQIELSAASRHSLSLPAFSVRLAPMAGDDISPEPAGSFDTSGVDLPAEWQNPPPPMTSSPLEPVPAVDIEQLSDLSGLFVGLAEPSPSPSAIGANHKQLLVNTSLNPSGTFADPWKVLLGIVYLTPDAYVSPQHSLAFADNDIDDPSPYYDFFYQTVVVPPNLTSARFDFAALGLNRNNDDLTIVALWTVNGSGDLDEIVGAWQVKPIVENWWEGWFVEISDEDILRQLQGSNIALSFSSETTESLPNEIIFFDDITFDVYYTDPPSYIIVKKQTTPSGSSQKFTFDPSWSGSNFQLSHGGSKTSPSLAAGTYSVKELAQSGWKMSGATCDDGSDPNSISLQAGDTVTCTFNNVQEISENCRQLLVNTKMDVVELGDETGTVEPWSIIFQTVYYTNDTDLAYDGYSMVLVDGDTGDSTPGIDMFAQGLLMPGNLTEVRIEYQHATRNTNLADEVYGELWLLDDDWILDLTNGDNFVMGWEVGESDGVWMKQYGTWNDSQLMKEMTGKKMAVLIFNNTEEVGDKENAFFDDIMLTACSKAAPSAGKAYLPSMMHNFGKPAGPICNPPSENPADQWHSDRGLVQTGATCSSTLSNVDRADYYTFKPAEDAKYTLGLIDPPEGTHWSAMIFVDVASPYYAPGSASDEKCRIESPELDKKFVECTLKKGTDYFVKVSAGSPPVAGSYEMKITSP